MLVAVFSDVQVNDYRAFNKDKSRLRNCLKAINKVFTFAQKNSIRYILFSGDWYDTQKVLGTEVVNAVIALLQKWEHSGIHIIAISGNHDHASKNLLDNPAVTGLSHIDAVISNFHLIDNSFYDLEDDNGFYTVRVHGVPYYEYSSHFYTALKSSTENITTLADANILLMHQTPNCMGNDMITPDTDINDPIYKKFDYVFNGHIHKHASLSRTFMNVGSPLHRTMEDEGQKKGFIIMDLLDRSEYKFIDTKLPEFRRKYEEDLTEEDEKHYVTVIPKPIVTKNSKGAITTPEDFKADLTPKELLTNFWKTVEGKDKELLQTGLDLL